MAGSMAQTLTSGDVFFKNALIEGVPTKVRCVEIGGQVFGIDGGILRTAGLDDDWYDDVRDPPGVIDALKSRGDLGVDLFTFWQRPPDTQPRYDYYHELEDVAVLPITTFQEWMRDRINAKTRNMVRKGAKRGVTVELTEFDDDFVRGLTKIFNEAPFRQGRRFWHYGKDFETVKRQFSAFIHRETMIRADLNGELIGLVMLGDAGRFALVQQILSSMAHRDKAVNNALIAKIVEVCEQRGFERLCYYYWGDDSLTTFKRNCGFERVAVPRYYVPLTLKGKMALKCGAHRGVVNMIPPGLKQMLKRYRSRLYAMRG